MTWLELLTGKPSAPKWRGPAQVHKLFSGGIEEEEAEKPEPLVLRDEKYCAGCEHCKPATTEFFYTLTVRGKRYLHPKCKVCMRAEQARRDSERRRGGA